MGHHGQDERSNDGAEASPAAPITGHPATDLDLRERLSARSAGILEEIFQRFGGIVFGVALSVTRDRAAAEDVTQVVMLDLWEHPEKYRPWCGPLRPWLALVAHHRSIEWLRGETARQSRESRALQPPQRHEPSAEERAEAILVAGEIRKSVDSLVEAERIPIMLAFYDGLSYRQVAFELGLPEGTVKSRIRSGLSHVQQGMKRAQLSEQDS